MPRGIPNNGVRNMKQLAAKHVPAKAEVTASKREAAYKPTRIIAKDSAGNDYVLVIESSKWYLLKDL